MSDNNKDFPSSKNQAIKEEGMPDISVHNKSYTQFRLAVMVILLGLLAIAFNVYYHSQKKEAPVTKENIIEESYHIPNVAVDKLPLNAHALPKAQAEPSSVPRELTEEQQQVMLRLEEERQSRLHAPILIVNNESGREDKLPSGANKQSATDPNMQYLQQVSSQAVDTLEAKSIGNMNTMIVEGTIIEASLESETNSDLPGTIRASVSYPVYSEDGERILIEPGSRLIGQYRSGMLQGQSRLFVVWTKLIQPVTNMAIPLGSQGVDPLGTAGIGADRIDSHFVERFGSASLLSIIGAGAANLGVQGNDGYNSAQAYRTAVAQSFTESAREAYGQTGGIPPTLHKMHGARVNVLVSHPLDFSKVIKRDAKHNLMVF
jgi:type IV secretion system protein VirB10